MAEVSLNVTDAPNGSAPIEVDSCVWETRQQHEVIPTILCSICLSVGLLYCFLGYRCFKMVMFLSGFMLGSAVVCLLSVVQKDSAVSPDSELGLETKAGISLGLGVLCGLLTMLLSTLGLFLTGLQLGAALSAAALLAVAQLLPGSVLAAPWWWWWWIPLTALLATSVLFAVLTLRWQKPLTVVSTAVCGAVAVAMSVDYLVEASPLVVQVCDVISGGAARPLCWFTWALLGTAPALCLAGILVQWKVTASGISHTRSADFAQKQDQTKALTAGSQFRRSHRRTNSQRRRRPPPLKRYAGDVLAPSYIQSLQERQIGTGSSSGSSRSNITCTVVDFDFETRSMAPLTASAPPAFRL